MTILTPTFVQANGAAGPHVIAPHEPTREAEMATFADRPTPTLTLAPETKPFKVAMIGTAPSSKMLAPYNDPSWTIWGCSPGNMNQLPRVDAWFELHSNLLWPEHQSYGAPYIEWLKQQKFPIYMQDQSLIPHATVFPRDTLVEEFGDAFFTSSFAWMMALAMKMGAVEIALYGIDMASRDEYIRQRPGFYYFKYRAEKLGVKVSAPNESDIMQSPPLYAYVDSTPFGRKIMARRQEVSGRINGLDQQIQQATHNKTYLQGALEDLDYFESIWGGVSNDISRLNYENAKQKSEVERLRTFIAQSQAQPALTPPPDKIARRRRQAAPQTTESHDG